ncbi:uncharacterized protein MONOS_17335 [Monocercomonoides exilis]|uniref:uncharacterized protein n=1 Tax=Monocercomonoides exilis TaxID=2049356 RepID=UPI003559CE6E|nr:hypothetical protein MONOS_17335 [Monocercomonoides exilis]
MDGSLGLHANGMQHQFFQVKQQIGEYHLSLSIPMVQVEIFYGGKERAGIIVVEGRKKGNTTISADANEHKSG